MITTGMAQAEHPVIEVFEVVAKDLQVVNPEIVNAEVITHQKNVIRYRFRIRIITMIILLQKAQRVAPQKPQV